MNQCENARRRFAAILASILCLPRLAFGMGSSSKPPKPPFGIPFAVHRKGEVLDTTMRIVEHRDYDFELRFRFKKNDMQDRTRMTNLVFAYYHDADGGTINRNQIALSLKIWEITPSGERSVADRRLNGFQDRGGGMGSDFLDQVMTKVALRPGVYRLRAETLKDLPGLETVATEFRVSWFYNARPYDN